jgi:GDP-4-dehydro-6-deoxy-D-mannose reductase
MRVLVTGIEGFVGSHCAEYLLTLPGVEIHGTVLNARQTANIDHLKPSLRLHEVDVCDPAAVLQMCDAVRPDRILHLAGQAFVPTSIRDPAATFRSNILGGLSVLEAARMNLKEHGTSPAVIIVSTGEVYGRVEPDRQPITEECPLQPNNPYAASKASIDLIAQQYRGSFGVDVVVVRPFNHAGARQNPVFVCSDFGKQFAEIAAGKRPPAVQVGHIEARRDFTDVRDVVKAYWLLFERKSRHVVFNISSGHALRIGEIVSMFQEISGVTVDIIAEPHRFRPYDVPVVVGSAERLKDVTGWSPVIPFRRTLQDVFEYWRKEIS